MGTDVAGTGLPWVDAIAGTGARVRDTRKTLPLLRDLQKYAVRCGGGVNHRRGLDDAVLIKDNHVAASGGVGAALDAVRAAGLPDDVVVQIEVDSGRLDPADRIVTAPAARDLEHRRGRIGTGHSMPRSRELASQGAGAATDVQYGEGPRAGQPKVKIVVRTRRVECVVNGREPRPRVAGAAHISFS